MVQPRGLDAWHDAIVRRHCGVSLPHVGRAVPPQWMRALLDERDRLRALWHMSTAEHTFLPVPLVWIKRRCWTNMTTVVRALLSPEARGRYCDAEVDEGGNDWPSRPALIIAGCYVTRRTFLLTFVWSGRYKRIGQWNSDIRLPKQGRATHLPFLHGDSSTSWLRSLNLPSAQRDGLVCIDYESSGFCWPGIGRDLHFGSYATAVPGGEKRSRA